MRSNLVEKEFPHLNGKTLEFSEMENDGSERMEE